MSKERQSETGPRVPGHGAGPEPAWPTPERAMATEEEEQILSKGQQMSKRTW